VTPLAASRRGTIEEVTIEMNGVLPPPEEIRLRHHAGDQGGRRIVGNSETIPRASTAPAHGAAQKLGRIQQLHRDVKLHFQVTRLGRCGIAPYEPRSLAPSNAYYHALLAKSDCTASGAAQGRRATLH
jgi:hypothetical protein